MIIKNIKVWMIFGRFIFGLGGEALFIAIAIYLKI